MPSSDRQPSRFSTPSVAGAANHDGVMCERSETSDLVDNHRCAVAAHRETVTPSARSRSAESRSQVKRRVLEGKHVDNLLPTFSKRPLTPNSAVHAGSSATRAGGAFLRGVGGRGRAWPNGRRTLRASTKRKNGKRTSRGTGIRASPAKEGETAFPCRGLFVLEGTGDMFAPPRASQPLSRRPTRDTVPALASE